MAQAQIDVFLSQNSKDNPVVERIAEKLRRTGLESWLDKWTLTLGGRCQEEIGAGLQASRTFTVFVGPQGIGDWVKEQLAVALDRAAKDRSFRVFPVLLPGLREPFDTTTLPPLLRTHLWVDLRAGFEDQRSFQHLVNAVKGLPLGPDRPTEERPAVCPYSGGLQAFEEHQAPYFLGREADVQRLTKRLKSKSLLAVLGPSGSCKSSVVRAGLIPALRKEALPGSHMWEIRVFTSGAHPLTMLTSQLLDLYPSASEPRLDSSQVLHYNQPLSVEREWVHGG